MADATTAEFPDVGAPAIALARAVRDAGGTALVVGGWVRDALLGVPSQDVDLEVHGLSEAALAALVDGFGAARRVGRSHPVWLVGRPPLEVSLAPDAEGASSSIDERHAAAARRRDLTINSMAWEPLAARFFDPHGGGEDLRARRLRAVDEAHFGDDPLRVLRVARLAARLGAEPTASLAALCARQELGGLPPERVLGELRRLLATPAPGHGLRTLRRIEGLRALPELAALVDVPQDARWHPEGCVWTHTCMVVDEAARLATETPDTAERDDWLRLGALCHDLGKPATTTIEEDGRVRSPAHDLRGAEIATIFLERLRAGERTVRAVSALVRWHLAPMLYPRQEAGDGAYRRLVRRLASGGVDPALLLRVARADHLGRTTPEARARRFEVGEQFAARLRALDLAAGAPTDCVRGRDVLAQGIAPGPQVARVLERCRVVQDRTGWRDGERILRRALAELSAEPST